MPRQLLLLTSLLGLLAGCQSAPVKDIHSPFYAPPVGSILQLHTPIDMPANELSVIIQYGKIQPSSWQLDQYAPHCDFELRDRHGSSPRVEPDRFVITRVIQDTENVLLTPLQLAGLGANGAPPLEEYQVIMYLHSDKQPNVFRMTCKHWSDPNDAEHLSIVKIREALGKMFSLVLVDD